MLLCHHHLLVPGRLGAELPVELAGLLERMALLELDLRCAPSRAGERLHQSFVSVAQQNEDYFFVGCCGGVALLLAQPVLVPFFPLDGALLTMPLASILRYYTV